MLQALGALLVIPAATAAAQTDVGVTELRYRVQAAFLYNFARFVEWPAPGEAASDAFNLCVYDDPQFANVIAATVAGKRIDERQIVVRRPDTPEASSGCHILYVESLRNQPILMGRLQTQTGTLVVGEDESFIRDGGSIAFFTEAGRIRFAINPDAAARAGLRVSSKLLAVARIES